jgi:hypothetical protein
MRDRRKEIGSGERPGARKHGGCSDDTEHRHGALAGRRWGQTRYSLISHFSAKINLLPGCMRRYRLSGGTSAGLRESAWWDNGRPQVFAVSEPGSATHASLKNHASRC